MFDALLKSLGLSKEKVDAIASETSARVAAFEKSQAEIHAKLDALAAHHGVATPETKNTWFVQNGEKVIAMHDARGDNLGTE